MEDIFNFIHEKDGGRLDVNNNDLYQSDFLKYLGSIPSCWIQVADKLLDKAYPDGRPRERHFPKIEFGFVDTCGINCSATLCDDEYIVGMGGLLPTCVIELVCFFMRRDDFLPQIGNLDERPLIKLDGFEAPPFFQLAENSYFSYASDALSQTEAFSLIKGLCSVRGNTMRFNHETGTFLSATEYLKKIDTVLDCIQPQCSVRRKHVEYFTEMLITFFWMHEIFHILSGHLLIKNQHASGGHVRMFEFTEYGFIPSRYFMTHNQQPIDLLQLTMEIDADQQALLFVIGIILEDLDDEIETAMDKNQRVSHFLFLLTAIFSNIEMHSNQQALYKSDQHPPSNVRLLHLLSFIKKLDDAKEPFHGVANETIAMVTHYRQYIDCSFFNIGLEFSKENAKLMEKIGAKDNIDKLNSFMHHYPSLDTVIYDTLMKMNKVGLYDMKRFN